MMHAAQSTGGRRQAYAVAMAYMLFSSLLVACISLLGKQLVLALALPLVLFIRVVPDALSIIGAILITSSVCVLGLRK